MNFFETVRQLQEETFGSMPADRAHAYSQLAYDASNKGDHTQAAKSHRAASIMHHSVLHHASYAHDSDEAKRGYHTIMAKHHEDLQKHHETHRTA